jgi:hypothetical protein
LQYLIEISLGKTHRNRQTSEKISPYIEYMILMEVQLNVSPMEKDCKMVERKEGRAFPLN